ncbi:MAG: phage tail protein [Gemmatimonadota bacterium]|jgi:phage tail-like protein
MADGKRNDPYGQFNFVIEVDGVIQGGFSEVSGLTTDTDVIEYREGSEDFGTARKLPGLMKYNNIVLKRGWTQDRALWEWRKKVIDGKTERTSGAIVLKDEARKDALRWEFREGWPCKWEGPALNGKTSEVAIETLEICHEGLVLVG